MPEQRYEATTRPKRCPACGSAKVAKILWGMPAYSAELERQLAEGKVKLGGCIVSDHDPKWSCAECNVEIYRVSDMSQHLGRIRPERLTGEEPIHDAGTRLGGSVGEFWQWAGSDLVGNTFRGWLAEYLVALALGQTDGTREDWGPYDLLYKLLTEDRVKIEVKASAYVQSWTQKKLSTPQFSIRPALAWDAETDTFSREAKRHSHIYVFCLHAHKEQKTLDPRNVAQWEFYVLPTRVLDEKAPEQKSIGLPGLRALGAQKCSFGKLAVAITNAAHK